MKIAFVYDRANKWGGAERVLLALLKAYPGAHLYTSVYAKDKAKWVSNFSKVKTSFLQGIPFAKNNHEYFCHFMPMAFESFDFRKYDLVISVTSEFAKGVITSSDTKHICYLLTPTRYLWSGYDFYFSNKTFSKLTSPIVSYLRNWDKLAAKRPDHYISISTEVARRAKKYYGTDSRVLHPPYNDKAFGAKKIGSPKRKERFLLVSRLVKYKRVDLAIQAFNQLNYELVVVGEGREKERLRSLAGPNIKFLSNIPDALLCELYRSSKALIFPQIEDFGIVAVEAQSQGLPVIALGRGGVTDIVKNGKTGVFFEKQTKKDIIDATKRFQSIKLSERDIIDNALAFKEDRFIKEFRSLVKILK